MTPVTSGLVRALYKRMLRLSTLLSIHDTRAGDLIRIVTMKAFKRDAGVTDARVAKTKFDSALATFSLLRRANDEQGPYLRVVRNLCGMGLDLRAVAAEDAQVVQEMQGKEVNRVLQVRIQMLQDMRRYVGKVDAHLGTCLGVVLDDGVYDRPARDRRNDGRYQRSLRVKSKRVRQRTKI